MKAILKNYRQSPRKVRLIADLVRGKTVSDAIIALSILDKRAAEPFAKVIRSAEANAKNLGMKTEGLVVKSVAVDKGTVLKRFMPRARGSASRILKRNSHISVELGSSAKPKAKSKKKKVAVKK